MGGMNGVGRTGYDAAMTQMPDFRFSRKARRAKPQPISYLMAQAVDNPELISLAAGLVDEATLPADEVRDLLSTIFTDEAAARRALQYGTTEGLADLRRALLEHVAALDDLDAEYLNAAPEDVVVTTGSQQLLYILTDLLVDEGDIVITEWPSYFVYTNALEAMGATVRCVEMDEGGLVVESLENLLAELARAGQLSRVKIVYTCSYYQNPTGLTLAADRREPLLRLIQRYSTEHRILLIEDAAYRELAFDGAAPPSIKSYDDENRFVALAQTFSKPFSPGFKTGYGILPRDLVGPVLKQKGMQDFGSANFNQHLLHAALRSGAYAKHVKRLQKRYAEKCAATLNALQREFADMRDAVTWTQPTGGLYVWLTLAEDIDASRESALFAGAIAEGVLYVPGAYCYPADAERRVPMNTIRLSFGVPSIEQIEQGVQRLARAVRGCK